VVARCDVTDAEVEAAVKAALDAFGRIDILVNIAGTGPVGSAAGRRRPRSSIRSSS
jgi:NAD(P)-dependent dehydrogenase (short-subunit alcohol dehydrogenase family)